MSTVEGLRDEGVLCPSAFGMYVEHGGGSVYSDAPVQYGTVVFVVEYGLLMGVLPLCRSKIKGVQGWG